LARHALAISRLRIALHLAKRRMSGNRRDLIRAASDLGESASGRLAQSMRRHVGAFGLIAKLAKPIAEAGCRIGLTEVSHQERLGADGRGRVDNLAQLRMHRNFEMGLLTALGLALIDTQDVTVDVLASDFDHVAAPLSGIEQESEREASFATDRML